MTFEEIVDQAIEMIKRRGRVTYRMLKRQFDLDDEALEDLKEEIIDAQRVAVEEDGRILIWTGDTESASSLPTSVPASAPSTADKPSPISYTPQYLSEKILTSRSALEGERKQVTVMFCDIKDSTELIRDLDPEDAQKLLDPAIHIMMDAVHRFEGTVNQVLGDGIMAIFGAPIAHEDHAARACYAALAMQAAMQPYADEMFRSHGITMRIRVGLNSGEVVVRTIGNDLHMDYSAVGQTTNLASRMEQLAAPGTITLTGETLRLVEGMIRVNARGPVPVKGMTELVEVYELTGASTIRRRLQAAVARGLTKFVGRDIEMKALNHALEQATKGQGQIVAAVGEAGVGKSRLVYEFIHSHRTQGWLVLESASVSYGKATPYFPVIDLLKRYVHIEDGDDPRTIRAKVTGQILTLDAAFQETIPALLSLLDALPEDSTFLQLDPPQRRQRTLDGLKRILLRESQVQPLLLIFEDLHWIDSETQALLDSLVESLPATQLLLLVNYRPEYQHSWGSKTFYTQLRLDPLPPEGADTFLEALLGNDTSLEPIKKLLIERTEGNPFFLEESVRILVETQVLIGESGTYRLAQELPTIQVPATVQAILAARIDRLPQEEKQLLQTAAVIGTEVPFKLLQSIAEIPEEVLHRSLNHLQAAEFLYETTLFPECVYTFKHALTHEVTYGSLLQERRRLLHAQVAKTMQNLYPERRTELAETLARHCERGERWNQALTYYLLAAEKGKHVYIYEQASNHAHKALEMAEKTPERNEKRVQSLGLLGDLASLMGDLDGANAYYEQALTLSTEATHYQHIANRVHHRHFTSRNGTRIAFYVHGMGEETLFLASPAAYRVGLFQPALEALCQEFRVVTFDPRGTGASDPIPEQYPIRERVADLRAVVEALACGPVIGVGISQAGSHMARLAWTYPTLLKKLVMVGTRPGRQGELEVDFPGPPEKRMRQRQAIGRGDLSELKDYITWHAYTVFSEPEARDLAEDYIRTSLRQPPAVWRNFVAGSRLDPDYHIGPLLGDIHVPTLVAHGTADRMNPFAMARYIVERLPDAQLYAFEGKGHHPMFTAPHEFCEVLRHFVRTGTAPKHAWDNA